MADSSDVLGSLAKLHIKHDRDMLAAIGRSPEEARQVMPSAKLDWSVEDGKGFYAARGRCASVYTGYAERFEKATDGQISIAAPEFAAVMVTALDKRPLNKSRKILITACGRCENTGMKFPEDRRTVGRNWGGPPVQIQPVEGTLTLPKGRWICHALSPDGLPKGKVPVQSRGNKNTIQLSPQYKTMWYLLTRER